MLKFYYYKLCTNIICNIEIKHLLNYFKDQMKLMTYFIVGIFMAVLEAFKYFAIHIDVFLS